MTDLELCSYEYIDDLHILTFHDNTPKAINTFFAHMDRVYQGVTKDMTLCFLVDIYAAGKPLPLWKAFSTGQQWANSLKVHPHAKVAFVYYPTLLVSFTESLFRTTGWGHLEVGLFNGAEPNAYEQAIAWLQVTPKHERV